MSADLYLAFVGASIILVLIPGPNVALIVANSVAHGARFGLLMVAGTTAAMMVQVTVAVLGLSALLTTAAFSFEWLRWLGVVYLIYLGVRTWIAAPVDLNRIAPQPRSRRILLTGFLVSLTNPKTLLFYGAFMPQFVSPSDGETARQLAILSATFVIVAAVFDSAWALLAGRFRGALAQRGKVRNRITGGLLLTAGLGLALARKP